MGDVPVAGRLLVFCGVPGSGKTTIAHIVAESRPGAVHIQTDTVRGMISEPTFSAGESELVYNACTAAAREALDAGRLVILDATFGSRRRREKTAGSLSGHYSRVDFVLVACDLETALGRNSARPGMAAVPREKVIDMVKSFDAPEEAFVVESSKDPPRALAERIVKGLRL